MTKRICSVVLLVMFTLSFFGCAKPEAPADPTPEPTGEIVELLLEATPVVEMDELSGIGITILYEQDDDMMNSYSVIAVNEEAPFQDLDGNTVKDVAINTIGAKALTDWLMSDEATQMIETFGVCEYGEALFTLEADKPVSIAEIPQATEETKTIRFSTTTSVNDSGLLAYLLPAFESKYGYKVEVFAAGTGKAIAAAVMGNADLILVHSKSQEEAFIADGYGKVLDGYDSERLTFMYNYFVLIGPKNDPAKCAEAASVKDAFSRIVEGMFPFVSRGDLSGTHTKEVSLWPEAFGITTDPASVAAYTAWYLSSNAGMGVCLTMANEMDAYILSDKATFLAFEKNGGFEG